LAINGLLKLKPEKCFAIGTCVYEKTFSHESRVMIKERVFECMKVSIRTVKRILRQRVDFAEINGEISMLTSPKKSHKKCTDTNLDDANLYNARNISYNYNEGCRVIVEHLKKKLKNDLGWEGSTSSLRRVLTKIGFKWRTTLDSTRVLVET
jgi:hypothetical protein